MATRPRCNTSMATGWISTTWTTLSAPEHLTTMIEARQFVEPAKQLGFDFWAGVPCSFLTPFINYTISDSGLDYISSANEGDAVAVATGAVLGGRRSVAMMQNSGLGNAVSPLTSLNHVFRVPVLLIVTLRGNPVNPMRHSTS